MKLKQAPRDFRVFEELEFEADPQGSFHVHKLVKEKLGTLEALDRVARVARVPRSAIAYAGLKDRQAVTQQFISIENRRVEIHERGLKVRFVGRCAEKITSKLSGGNRFHVVVRDLDPPAIARLRRNKRSVLTDGLPNYFDDQRFGCLKHGQGFVVRSLAERRPDRALRQLIATPPSEERGGDAKLRRLLHEHWGDWEACRQIARGPMYEAIFDHLQRQPDDFAGALARIPTRLKLIHVFAFQSWLFNLGVQRLVEAHLPSGHRTYIPTVMGELPCWRYLRADVRSAFQSKELPLIDARTEHADPEFAAAMQAVLKRLRLSPADLDAGNASGFRLKEEPRRLVLRPADLTVLGPWRDERNAGRVKVELRFKLPRGAYATLVVRRLFAEPATRRPRDRSRPGRSRGGPGKKRRPGPSKRAGRGGPRPGRSRDKRP